MSNLSTIVTAKHVVAESVFTDESQLSVTTPDNKKTTYQRPSFNIYYVTGADLAVIKLSKDLPLSNSVTPIMPNFSYPFTLHDELAVVYQDGGKVNAMNTKIISENIKRQAEGEIVTVEIAENHGTINPGDSGGGVFYQGKLVGVNTATTSDIMFFITSIASGQQYLDLPTP